MRFFGVVVYFVIATCGRVCANSDVAAHLDALSRRAISPTNVKLNATVLHNLNTFMHSIQHVQHSLLEKLHLSHLVTLHGNATNHWCCNVATTRRIVQSHSKLIYTKQVKDRVSHHHCGFLGLSRCARHHYYYVSVPAYKTTYTYRTIHTTCPSSHLVCCKDYILVADNCIPLSEIPNIKDDLIKLHNANIPVGR
ncbi:uncharacterized protein LOC128164417 [Crassostrea angulata]|uniref:Uncharacterized protein n=2 Tax=Magallana gigas TaxID=29159 RepID=A0A8W8KAD9_MAGGI|nr:uncharacterized protein LOC105347061 [Crassostrea gigas]XP_052684170.1 uncharacterized protein LOC128164417 [Crassostrea angulata]|eukprot:XP_011454253.1 PREDICTED: uncharacterized protein LOC105347061 [Crassostrea gigas]